jgi:hypothetical protein
LTVAVALSIALHEIAAGFVPPGVARAPERTEIVTRARILRVARRATPPPRRMPAPVVAPAPPIVARTVPIASRHPRVLAAIAEGRAGGPHAHLAFANAKPIWDLSGPRTVAAAASGPSQGGGNGAGTDGNGTAAISGEEPCGFVTFSDPHGSQFDPQTKGFRVDIRMSVHLADGSSESMILDYPWYYASEAANPWSDQNLKDPNFPTRFQTPPAAKLADEPKLVKFVVAHSTPDGMTLLRDCPQR